MKKYSFLVPFSSIVASIATPNAEASVAPSQTVEDGKNQMVQPNLERDISMGGQVTVKTSPTDTANFTLKRNGQGLLMAEHSSHASHASHVSHRSHYSSSH